MSGPDHFLQQRLEKKIIFRIDQFGLEEVLGAPKNIQGFFLQTAGTKDIYLCVHRHTLPDAKLGLNHQARLETRSYTMENGEKFVGIDVKET